MAKANTKKRPGAVAPAKGVGLAHRSYPQDVYYSALIAEGMPPARAKVGSAIIMAESGGRMDAVGDGGTSFGPGQVHTPAHPQYNPHKLMNSLPYSMRAIQQISGNGKDWTPWSTYNSGAYRKFMKGNLKAAKNPDPQGAPTTNAGSAQNLPNPQVAGALGGLPGTLTGLHLPDPGAALGPFDPFDPGQRNPLHGLGIGPDVNPLSGATDALGNALGNIFPIQILDTFRLFNHLFEAKFWFEVGKVILGVVAIYIGANALLKLSTGVDVTRAAKNAVGTAGSIAATAAK